MLLIFEELYSMLLNSGELYSMLLNSGELYSMLLISGQLYSMLSNSWELHSMLLNSGELYSLRQSGGGGGGPASTPLHTLPAKADCAYSISASIYYVFHSVIYNSVLSSYYLSIQTFYT